MHLKPLLLSSLVAATLGDPPVLAQVNTQSTPDPQYLFNAKGNLEQSLSSRAERLVIAGDDLALFGVFAVLRRSRW